MIPSRSDPARRKQLVFGLDPDLERAAVGPAFAFPNQISAAHDFLLRP